MQKPATHTHPKPPDSRIIQLINDNSLSGWQHLYDKYSGMMYGILVTKCGNEELAEQLLEKIFLELQEEKSKLCVKCRLPNLLINRTLQVSAAVLQGRAPDAMLPGPSPILCTLLYTHNSIMTIAMQNGLSCAAAKKRLHIEMKELLTRQEGLKKHPEQWHISTAVRRFK